MSVRSFIQPRHVPRAAGDMSSLLRRAKPSPPGEAAPSSTLTSARDFQHCCLAASLQSAAPEHPNILVLLWARGIHVYIPILTAVPIPAHTSILTPELVAIETTGLSVCPCQGMMLCFPLAQLFVVHEGNKGRLEARNIPTRRMVLAGSGWESVALTEVTAFGTLTKAGNHYMA